MRPGGHAPAGRPPAMTMRKLPVSPRLGRKTVRLRGFPGAGGRRIEKFSLGNSGQAATAPNRTQRQTGLDEPARRSMVTEPMFFGGRADAERKHTTKLDRVRSPRIEISTTSKSAAALS